MEPCCTMSRHKYRQPNAGVRSVQLKVIFTLVNVAIREGQAVGEAGSAYTRFGNARTRLENTLCELISGQPKRVARHLPPRLREDRYVGV